MKKVGNKNLKIIAATSMAIFSLFACFSAVYAWFAATRKISNEADAFKVESYSGILESVSTHRLVKSASTDSAYAFDTTPIDEEMVIDWNTAEPSAYVSTELDRYNPLEVHKPVLILFTFRDGTPDNNIQIRGDSTSSSFVGYVTNKDGNPLSSVVEFQSASYATTPTVSNGNYIITKSTLSTPTHFVNITNDAAGYPTVAEDGGFVSTQYLYQGTTTNTIKYVGVIIDYYEPAMSYLFSVNLGNSLFEMDVADAEAGVINFICDWRLTI